MKTSTTNPRARAARLTLAAVALAALAACGGGGDAPGADPSGGSDAPGAPGFVDDLSGGGGFAAPAPAGIQTAVPAATYQAASGAAAAYALLNAERQRCGFGLLAQNDKLDLAAADANGYWALRVQESDAAGFAYGHFQDPGASGFTGVTPSDRAAHRGYAYSTSTSTGGVGESVVTPYGLNAPFNQPSAQIAERAMRVLLSSVYHAVSVLDRHVETGVAWTAEVPAPSGDFHYRLTVKLATPQGEAQQDEPGLRTYPCEGSRGANAHFAPADETPNPAPDLGEAFIGPPILLQAGAGQALAVTSYSIVPAAGGAAIAARVITAENDVHQAVAPHTAFVVPLQSLSAGAAYRVEVGVTIDGAPTTRSFTFTPADTFN